MSRFVFSSKNGFPLKRNDIAQAIKYFDKEDRKEGSKIIIPLNLVKDKQKIEQEFNRKVEVAPIRGDHIHIFNQE